MKQITKYASFLIFQNKESLYVHPHSLLTQHFLDILRPEGSDLLKKGPKIMFSQYIRPSLTQFRYLSHLKKVFFSLIKDDWGRSAPPWVE